MPRLQRRWLLLLLFFFSFIILEVRGLGEDDPLLLDRFIHWIWDPSGLVRFWVALDQLHNIASSWGGVARSLITLPFKGHLRDKSHISIKCYNGTTQRLGGDSISAHRDRFARAYSGWNDLPFPSSPGLDSALGLRDPQFPYPVNFGNEPKTPPDYVRDPSNLGNEPVNAPNYIRDPSNFGNEPINPPDYVHFGNEPMNPPDYVHFGNEPITQPDFVQHSPLLGKYLSGSYVGSSPLLKFPDFVKDYGDITDYGEQLWMNPYMSENVINAFPVSGVSTPNGYRKSLKHVLNSMAYNSDVKLVSTPQHNVEYPHLQQTGAPSTLQPVNFFLKGTNAPGLKPFGSMPQSSKIQNLKGTPITSENNLHQSKHRQDTKAPLGMMSAILGDTDPQVRLQMTLRLMKELGLMYAKRIESHERRKNENMATLMNSL